jgi:hypothetical protein
MHPSYPSLTCSLGNLGIFCSEPNFRFHPDSHDRGMNIGVVDAP